MKNKINHDANGVGFKKLKANKEVESTPKKVKSCAEVEALLQNYMLTQNLEQSKVTLVYTYPTTQEQFVQGETMPATQPKTQSFTFTYRLEAIQTKPIFTESTYNKALKNYHCSHPQETIATLEERILSSCPNLTVDKIAIQCLELLGNAYYKLYQTTKTKQDLTKSLYYLEFTLENAHIYKHSIGYDTINNVDSATMLLKEIVAKEELYKQAVKLKMKEKMSKQPAELISSEESHDYIKLLNQEDLAELLGITL